MEQVINPHRYYAVNIYVNLETLNKWWFQQRIASVDRHFQ